MLVELEAAASAVESNDSRPSGDHVALLVRLESLGRHVESMDPIGPR